MTYDKFYLLDEFLHFNGRANYSYDLNDRRRGCCPQVCPFTDMKICRKLHHPKRKLSVGKSPALFECQLHYKQYTKTKRVCFGMKIFQLTSSNNITSNFQLTAGKVYSIKAMKNVICQHQKEPLFAK